MKKNNIKSLQLKKKSIAKITSDQMKGGIWTTTFTTIRDLTNSCPHKCGSQQQ